MKITLEDIKAKWPERRASGIAARDTITKLAATGETLHIELGEGHSIDELPSMVWMEVAHLVTAGPTKVLKNRHGMPS